MTNILVLHEKHEDRYLAVPESLELAAQSVVTERLEDGYWYLGEVEDEARAALEKGVCLYFLDSRSGHEYENFDVETLEEGK